MIHSPTPRLRAVVDMIDLNRRQVLGRCGEAVETDGHRLLPHGELRRVLLDPASLPPSILQAALDANGPLHESSTLKPASPP